MMKLFTKSRGPKEYKAKGMRVKTKEEIDLYSRQRLIPGFFQHRMSDLKVAVVGAGGNGGELVEGLVRKGAGEIHIWDPDLVEPTNLNRQKFYKEDLSKNKALRLAKNMKREATSASLLVGYPFGIQELTPEEMKTMNHSFDAIAVLVDNESVREFCSQAFHIPAVFAAAGLDSERFYIMVQEPGGPCYRCVVPKAQTAGRFRCHAASSIDISKAVSGLVLFAIDSIVMNRAREWNYREVNFCGFPQDKTLKFKSNPNCQMCNLLKDLPPRGEFLVADEVEMRKMNKYLKNAPFII